MAALDDKPAVEHHETLKDEGFPEAAERGHLATDRCFRPIRAYPLPANRQSDTATPSSPSIPRPSPA